MDSLMTFWVFLIGIIAGIIFGVTLIHRIAISPLHKKIEKLTREKQSLSSTYGKITEQYASFMERYPYDIENYRFIGNPIDGIQFEEDNIIFVKFITNKSKLTSAQNKIKKLVKERRIKWFELRMK